jgi:serine/threonine-protein kinase HipA
MTDTLVVAVEIGGETVEAGTAYFTRRRGTLSTAFRYSEDYLARPDAYALDPGLPMFRGAHNVSGLPGAFSDCAPDRWGRNLISKRVRVQALRDGRVAPTLSEVDYLTRVSDRTRQGALRFRAPDTESFLDPDDDVPKLVELPALLNAADRVARDDDDLAAIKVLLTAGTGTLGGARPKASVREGDLLYIAKFPHHADSWDVIAWETTALDLAEHAGIEVPLRRLERIDGRAVLLLERFDRDTSGDRIGYLSAMTMVEGRDGDAGRDYVELAETMPEYASHTVAELRELWRRIAFSIAIHNTDDHLRNHGFLRSGRGWRLSPAFDVNPNPDVAEHRTTAIGGATARRDELDGLMVSADVFGLDQREAAVILSAVFEATERWERVAAGNGIGAGERRRFEDAFDGLRRDADHLVGDSRA